MKKLLTMIMALMMLCAVLAGCGPDADNKDNAENNTPPVSDVQDNAEEKIEFVPGVRTERDYTNESIGLKFTLNDQMVMASDEEMSNMMELGVDIVFEDTDMGKKLKDISEISTVYDMMAVDIFTNSNVIIMAEKLQFSGITLSQYIDALKIQLDSTGLVSEYKDVYDTELCGITFSNLTYTMSFDGAELIQTMLFEKLGDRIVAISFTYFDDESYNAMLECFSKL